MKKTAILLYITFLTFSAFSKDVIHLKNGRTIKCTLVDLKKDSIYFIKKKKNGVRLLTSDMVDFILIGENNQAFQTKISNLHSIIDPLEACQAGKMDANLFHHRGFGNGCLGFFFGLFGIAGTVIGRPHPPPIEVIVVRDKEMVMNPAYLSCYRKRAKGKNIISAAIGYGVFLVVLLTIQASK